MRDATRAIVSNYLRNCWWLEKHDLIQEAELAKLEAARYWKPGGAPLEAYLARVVANHLCYYVARCRCPVYAPTNRIGAMYETQPCAISAARNIPASGQPPVEHMDRARMAELVRRALAVIALGDLAAEVLLAERKPAEVAAARGVPVQKVYRATRDARRALREDEGLRAFVEE
jgi:DNA-directed RNA polymerase specialized sigma24 family protein